MRTLAIYPGSFDPPTLGHLDVIERASKMFDHIVVGVGVNAKKEYFLTAEERVAALVESVHVFPNVRVEKFEGLLTQFARSLGAKSIVRGLRATSDFDYEFQMAMVNRRLAPEIDSAFLMTKWEYSYLSSSIVREVAILGGDFSSMVPPAVAKLLSVKIASNSVSQS